jgi:Ca2+-transporting ATPase
MEGGPIYQLRPAQVYDALETSLQGLSAEQAEARQDLFGKNLLSEEAKTPLWRKLTSHLLHPWSTILEIAGILAFAAGDPVLGVIILMLILLSVTASFFREYRAEQAMEALRRLLPAYARVLRASVEISTPASELVPGDILVLAEGDNIPADARVVEEYGLRVNNATLTGEAVPARKTADASLRDDISEVERPNLLFAGTSVVSGTGRAVVYATGMLTQFGRIAHLTQTVAEIPSPLQVELNSLTKRILIISLSLSFAVFLIGQFDIQLNWSKSFLLALGVLVAAVPEGLPTLITLSLARAGQRLAQRGVLVKKLSVIETLGTISTICTDKSGTLTQNQMTVREVWVGGPAKGYALQVSGVGYEPVGEFSPNPAGQPFEADLHELLVAATLCNNSRLSSPTPQHPQWTNLGDQTEAALRVAALKDGIDEKELVKQLPRIHEIPFDARRKRMSTIHQFMGVNGVSRYESRPDNKAPAIAYVKGAPREVLQLCNSILVGGQVQPLDEAQRNTILTANDGYARRALRVLALARRELPARFSPYSAERIERGLTFLGLMAMHDPPRPEVAEAISTLQRAGIRMIMITGDYGLTAESLARRVGMLRTPDPLILTGAELDTYDDIQLNGLFDKEVIFARMAPEHKMRLVAALQGRGEVVAVTGDGVNDAPALRKADVGLAMGIIGTDVAKEAADIVLTNDNFASVVQAIREGRALYDNLRKVLTYIFSSNVPQILPFLLSALVGLQPALTARQILAIDMGTDMLPALGLSGERPEPGVMKRPPRRRTQRVMDQALMRRALTWLGVIEATLCYAGFFFIYIMAGKSPMLDGSQIALWQRLRDYFIQLPALQQLATDLGMLSKGEVDALASTVFFAGLVTTQIGNAFACRTEEIRHNRLLGWFSNRYLLMGVGFEIVMVLGLIYFDPLVEIFGHSTIPEILWIGLGLNGVVLYGLDWLRKWIKGLLTNRELARKEKIID